MIIFQSSDNKLKRVISRNFQQAALLEYRMYAVENVAEWTGEQLWASEATHRVLQINTGFIPQ